MNFVIILLLGSSRLPLWPIPRRVAPLGGGAIVIMTFFVLIIGSPNCRLNLAKKKDGQVDPLRIYRKNIG